MLLWLLLEELDPVGLLAGRWKISFHKSFIAWPLFFVVLSFNPSFKQSLSDFIQYAG